MFSPFYFQESSVSHGTKESPDPAGSTISLPVSETGSASGSAGGENRKKPWSIMKLFDRSARTKTDIGNLEDQLLTLKTSEFDENTLMRYKILHWSDLTPVPEDLSESEIKRREAIWEMFQSELVLLLDHLLVLKHVIYNSFIFLKLLFHSKFHSRLLWCSMHWSRLFYVLFTLVRCFHQWILETSTKERKYE